jgi:NAD(P)-dependent dehydrogenase (short-subunit alcohol dehydrogenase family)
MAIADVSNKSIAELVSLAGRRAVVTGGAQGLGHGIARRLAEAGASVLIGDVREDQAHQAAKDLSAAYGVRVIATRMDVTAEASVAAAADLAAAEFGGVDIWVNNAGLFPNIPLLEMTEAVWDEVMAVNLRGVFLGSREAARRMIDAGQGGVIVNVASLAAFKGVAPGVTAYVASKHGVRGATRQIALELAPHGVRVLGVAPTFVATEGAMAAFRGNPGVANDNPSILNTRLGRVGVADDVARVALFCASDMSLFMTGSTLLVDAGQAI